MAKKGLVEAVVEEGKKVGRPKKGSLSDNELLESILKETRAQTRALKGSCGNTSGNDKVRDMHFAEYFIPISGLPGSIGVQEESNRLMKLYPAEGWFPMYVTSESATLDSGGGALPGRTLMILWGKN